MELSTLQTFVKVVQAGSFTRAADALGSHKAHVSRAVTQLERQLGVRLLERSTRALSLTEVGREFFERAVGILAAVDDAQRVVQKAQGEPRGTLHLSCGVEFGMIAVNDWVARYLQRYPQVRVHADVTNRVVDIVHEGVDLAIRVGPLADSNLAARRLGDLHYGLFAAPAYLARRTLPTSPADLASHDTVVFSVASGSATWTLHSGTQQQAVALEPRLRANNVFAVRDGAVAALGVAQLPLVVAASALQAEQLVRVLPDWAGAPVPVHAVFASARYLTPKVRAFIDLAAQAMAVGTASPSPR